MLGIPNHIVFHPSIKVEDPSLVTCVFCNCWIVPTIVFFNFSSSQSTIILFFLGFFSWNTYSFVILLLITTLTSITFTLTMIILTLDTIFLSKLDAFFPWNIFCISTNLGQFVILCPFKPHMWQPYTLFF